MKRVSKVPPFNGAGVKNSCNKESAQKCLGLTLLDWFVFVHNTNLDFPCFATGRRTVES